MGEDREEQLSAACRKTRDSWWGNSGGQHSKLPAGSVDPGLPQKVRGHVMWLRFRDYVALGQLVSSEKLGKVIRQMHPPS